MPESFIIALEKAFREGYSLGFNDQVHDPDFAFENAECNLNRDENGNKIG